MYSKCPFLQLNCDILEIQFGKIIKDIVRLRQNSENIRTCIKKSWLFNYWMFIYTKRNNTYWYSNHGRPLGRGWAVQSPGFRVAHYRRTSCQQLPATCNQKGYLNALVGRSFKTFFRSRAKHTVDHFFGTRAQNLFFTAIT